MTESGFGKSCGGFGPALSPVGHEAGPELSGGSEEPVSRERSLAQNTNPPNRVGNGRNNRPDTGSTHETVSQSDGQLHHADVLIAAITSCTNTSNPSVMLAAGLLAKKAVEAGLRPKPLVKASLAPGSRVVSDYLNKTGLQPYLDKLGFNLVGYGYDDMHRKFRPASRRRLKTPSPKTIVIAAAVAFGQPQFRGACASEHPGLPFLMSPPIGLVAFALAGRVTIDLTREPLGKVNGREIFLKDLWPSQSEIRDAMQSALKPKVFGTYAAILSRKIPSGTKSRKTSGFKAVMAS